MVMIADAACASLFESILTLRIHAAGVRDGGTGALERGNVR